MSKVEERCIKWMNSTGVAERCIEWMNAVIECHKELYDEGDEMYEADKKAIEDAEYIIKCIKEVNNYD